MHGKIELIGLDTDMVIKFFTFLKLICMILVSCTLVASHNSGLNRRAKSPGLHFQLLGSPCQQRGPSFLVNLWIIFNQPNINRGILSVPICNFAKVYSLILSQRHVSKVWHQEINEPLVFNYNFLLNSFSSKCISNINELSV